jgi:CubicO group peptidase (beta-lactamase class C family)
MSSRLSRPAAGSRRRGLPALRAILAVTAAMLTVPWTGGPSAADGPTPALPRSAPEAQGLSSAALLDFVQTADREIDAMHSLMIVRHGHVVAEGWWAPYAPDVRHTMYSLTKSFTSTAVGLAIEEGRLSLDDQVLKFFPDLAPAEPSAQLKALRVRDLLSMATGHHSEPRLQGTKEWTKTFLQAEIAHKPGTFFLYNTPSTYMLTAILQKVTGQKTEDYLKPRLFEPLGIDDYVWETSPEGVTIGGYGLHLRTESIARFGQLYLQKGKWQGRQIVPEAWVAAATARQVSNGSNPASDWEQGYGFQFWRTRHGAYRGDGAFGQYCLVLPEQDTVIAITSGVKSMQAVLDLVFAKLLPAFKASPLRADPASHAALKKALAGLSLHVPAGAPAPGPEVTLGRRYAFPDNPEGIESLALERGTDGTLTLVTRVKGADRRLAMPHGSWAKGSLPVGPGDQVQPVATSGAWKDGRTFAATHAFYESPFKQNLVLTFDGDTVTYAREMHVAFGDTRQPTLTGRATATSSASQGR